VRVARQLAAEPAGQDAPVAVDEHGADAVAGLDCLRPRCLLEGHSHEVGRRCHRACPLARKVGVKVRSYLAFIEL
jgi:hypothetical protein